MLGEGRNREERGKEGNWRKKKKPRYHREDLREQARLDLRKINLVLLSYPILSYPNLSYPMPPILSYPMSPILSYPILSLCPLSLSYPILSYPILSYPMSPILSYPILSYPISPILCPTILPIPPTNTQHTNRTEVLCCCSVTQTELLNIGGIWGGG